LWENYPEIADEMKAVEEFIKGNTTSRNRLLSDIASALVGAGGKRLRPAFVILSAKFGSYDREKVLPLAGAVEILHTATLVHDDIIDRAGTRRGIPTVSQKYGIDMAVYTGDFLFTKAVLMLSKNVSTDKLDLVARAIKTICEGEVDQFQERYDMETSILSYLKRINKKTAVLFAASCLLGAQASECGDETSKKLARFGYCFGMAFQIRDDLLDFLSDFEAIGKPVGNDLPGGVITMPVIYALRSNSRLKEMFKGYAGKNGMLSIDDFRLVKDIVRDSGGVEASTLMLDRYIDRGIRALDKLPEHKGGAVLKQLLQALAL
jgi:heptaprenyl diphosphate synthase